MHDERLTPELGELAQQLAGIAPAKTAVDRDQIMFAAGIRSQSRRARRAVWSSAVLGLSIATLGVVVPRIFPPAQRVVERIVYVQQEQSNIAETHETAISPTAEETLLATKNSRLLAPQSYFQLRRIAVSQGVDALPDWQSSRREAVGRGPASRQELLEELLGS